MKFRKVKKMCPDKCQHLMLFFAFEEHKTYITTEVNYQVSFNMKY
jgi:hypothetical protein